MIEVPTIYLSNQTQYRLNEINKVENYFTTELQEKAIMSVNIF